MSAQAVKQAPKVEAPKVEAPKVEAPKVEAPKYSAVDPRVIRKPTDIHDTDKIGNVNHSKMLQMSRGSSADRRKATVYVNGSTVIDVALVLIASGYREKGNLLTVDRAVARVKGDIHWNLGGNNRCRANKKTGAMETLRNNDDLQAWHTLETSADAQRGYDRTVYVVNKRTQAA